MGNIIRKVIGVSAPLTAEQFNELETAAKSPATYDPDNPPLTLEELKGFKRVNSKPQNAKE